MRSEHRIGHKLDLSYLIIYSLPRNRKFGRSILWKCIYDISNSSWLYAVIIRRWWSQRKQVTTVGKIDRIHHLVSPPERKLGNNEAFQYLGSVAMPRLALRHTLRTGVQHIGHRDIWVVSAQNYRSGWKEPLLPNAYVQATVITSFSTYYWFYLKER